MTGVDGAIPCVTVGDMIADYYHSLLTRGAIFLGKPLSLSMGWGRCRSLLGNLNGSGLGVHYPSSGECW